MQPPKILRGDWNAGSLPVVLSNMTPMMNRPIHPAARMNDLPFGQLL